MPLMSMPGKLPTLLVVACLGVSTHASPQGQILSDSEIVARVDAAIADDECERAYALLEEAGERGKAWAYFTLGSLYEVGPCARDDVRLASDAHRRAVSGGFCSSYAVLGYLEPRLAAGPDGLERARRRYRSAALCWGVFDLSGSEETPLAVRVVMGHRGIPKDLREALDWVRSVEQGSPEAKTDLALKLAYGWGDLPRLPNRASLWLNQAAREDCALAGFELGKAYIDGVFGKPRLIRGLKELILVADQGHREAMLTLGSIYVSNDHGRFDAMKAFIWYSRAEAAGVQIDQNLLDRLKRRMSTEERRRAQYYLEGPPFGPSP